MWVGIVQMVDVVGGVAVCTGDVVVVAIAVGVTLGGTFTSTISGDDVAVAIAVIGVF